ncbi:MAG: hypothetical protein IPJ69_10855 [Deltaproteobacteria bacterium]|nr:MAG: hypothetical protein IPJ69_10855 [Deltaproteobacteria bacterium]
MWQNRVARLMKVSGLKSIHKLKYRPQTTQSKANDLVSPNVISQDFTAKQRIRNGVVTSVTLRQKKAGCIWPL